jgi:predicted nucleic acid-binding protein
VNEAFSEASARLLDDDVTLIAPELLFAEVSNALWALCRRGDIGPSDFAEAADTLKGAPIAVPSSMRHLAAAAGRLAIDLDHPVYDCFYLALAIQEQYPVITADAQFHDKVRGHPYLSDRILHVANVIS